MEPTEPFFIEMFPNNGSWFVLLIQDLRITHKNKEIVNVYWMKSELSVTAVQQSKLVFHNFDKLVEEHFLYKKHKWEEF